MRRRARYLRDASLAGWNQLVELSNHVGAALLVLLLVGLSVGSSVRFPHWWIGLIVFAAGYMLLFAEGAFHIHGEVESSRATALEELATRSSGGTTIVSDIRVRRTITERILQARFENQGPNEVPIGEVVCINVPASWGDDLDGNSWNVAYGDEYHNIHHQTPFLLRPGVTLTQEIPIPDDVHGQHTVALLIVGFHEQDHEVDTDP